MTWMQVDWVVSGSRGNVLRGYNNTRGVIVILFGMDVRTYQQLVHARCGNT